VIVGKISPGVAGMGWLQSFATFATWDEGWDDGMGY